MVSPADPWVTEPPPARSQRRRVGALLVVLCLAAWLVAGSAYIAMGLHSVGALPDFLRWFTRPRGPARWIPVLSALAGLYFILVLVVVRNLRPWVTILSCVAGLAGLIAVGVGPSADPRTQFELMRPELDRVAALPLVTKNPHPQYYEDLPRDLAFVSVNGSVSTDGHGLVFVPQWAGLIDDAGGYIYSPGRSPEGMDMWGMLCRKPVRLDGDWWACGMR